MPNFINIVMIDDDNDAWPLCHEDDLWIFDKLIVSRKLQYCCGPAGVPVPKPGKYIVRPIMNTFGMGRDAEIKFITNKTTDLKPATFWCEVFDGRHFSVDYREGKQVLCVEGIRDKQDPLYKWKEWRLVDVEIPQPKIVDSLVGTYDTINVEIIGDKVIEIHLRKNPDFINGIKRVIPVWQGQSKIPPDGMEFVPWTAYRREGFFVEY